MKTLFAMLVVSAFAATAAIAGVDTPTINPKHLPAHARVHAYVVKHPPIEAQDPSAYVRSALRDQNGDYSGAGSVFPTTPTVAQRTAHAREVAYVAKHPTVSKDNSHITRHRAW